MQENFLAVSQSKPLEGVAELTGAKNAVLVIMASLMLTRGTSKLTNVPSSSDVYCMISLLQHLGAAVTFIPEKHTLFVDTSGVNRYDVDCAIMQQMRASVLVMGPLLARFGRAHVGLPGGCEIGKRPIDLHLASFAKMGVSVVEIGNMLCAEASSVASQKVVLAYPSVGATENIMMFAAMTKGVTRIVNAALEPEVLDLMAVLKKMGTKISITAPSVIEIEGVAELFPVEHAVIHDRLEAGALLVAAAMTGGHIVIPQAPAFAMEVFLQKLIEMGHTISIGQDDVGVELWATKTPKAVSIKTGPHPQFPTDMQALMTVALCVADGVSIIEETVFENRFMLIHELRKMGANIQIVHDQKAIITGVDRLYGSSVVAPDIRASCALVLAGLVAQGRTVMAGVNHFKRAYDALDVKLNALGASVHYVQEPL